MAEPSVQRFTGQQMNLKGLPKLVISGYQLERLNGVTWTEGANIPLTSGIPQRAGLVVLGNRHLSSFVESFSLNVGEPWKDAKGSSHPMPTTEVGGVIVVGGVTTTLGDGSAVHRAKDARRLTFLSRVLR